MIARHWRGWTRTADADTYEKLLVDTVLPGLRHIEGYKGGYVLREEGPQESEFVVVNFFDSIDAVRRFAGQDISTPIFEPAARKLLSRIEPIAKHYDVRANTVVSCIS